MPDYSIIVPAYNEAEFLPACLTSLSAAMDACTGATGELIVVDNCSTDQTPDIAKRMGARVVFEPVNQISRARNAGAVQARGDILVFVDADTRIPSKLLLETLAVMNRGDCCGGGAVIGTSDPASRTMGWVIRLLNATFARFGYAAGAYVFCLREAFLSVGGFSDKVYAGEEILFVRQLKRWGRKRSLTFQSLPIAFDTSMRKARWHSETYMFVRMLGILLCPFLLRSKRWCALWYQRPDERVN